jgi:DNA-directed RNA polymerase
MLGERGWYWLRVHLANVAGQAKGKTYDERVDYVSQHIPDILDSANDPIHGLEA